MIDSRGQPLRGIKVEVAEDWSAQYVRTDAQGDFELRNIPPDRKINIRLSARGYGAREFAMYPKSQYTRQSLEIERAGTVRILLTDAWHRPAKDVVVRFWERRNPQTPGKAISVKRTTGRHGSVRVELPSGLYSIRILYKPEQGQPQWALETVDLKPNAMEILRIKLKDTNLPSSFGTGH